METNIDKLEADLSALRGEVIRIQSTVDDHEKELRVLREVYIRHDEKLDNINTKVGEVLLKVNSLTELPAQRWNDTVKTVISIIVTAVVTFAITKLIGQ